MSTNPESSPALPGGLRVALVNWRDPEHPEAGGAETYAWEISRRLAAYGARVTFLTARPPGLARRTRADGIDVVRMGGRFTVYPRVLGWLALRRRRFDAVLDCQNGIPFFTPWVVPVPVFCVVHHVHDRQFGVHFPPWLAAVGRFLEGPVARRTYRNHASIAVSHSTVKAMRERLRWTGPIHVVPNALTAPSAITGKDFPGETAGRAGKTLPRNCAGGGRRPVLVCVGRIVAHKRVPWLVALAGELRERHPGLELHIVGRGPDAGAVEAEVTRRGLHDTVRLHGHLPSETKDALVAGADLHLSASQGEGFGLSVLEAAALGVPSVAFDVDGLRESIRGGETGWLAPGDDGSDGDGGLRGLAEVVDAALKELGDPDRRAEVAAACRAWAATFDWDASARRVAGLLTEAVGRAPTPVAGPATTEATAETTGGGER